MTTQPPPGEFLMNPLPFVCVCVIATILVAAVPRSNGSETDAPVAMVRLNEILAPGSGVADLMITVGERRRVIVTMSGSNAIAGVVVDAGGKPVFGALVTALRLEGKSGERLVVAAETISDERGAYRIPILPLGEYFVKASPPQTW